MNEFMSVAALGLERKALVFRPDILATTVRSTHPFAGHFPSVLKDTMLLSPRFTGTLIKLTGGKTTHLKPTFEG